MPYYQEVEFYDAGGWGSVLLDNGDTIHLNGDGTGHNTDGELYQEVHSGTGTGFDMYYFLGWSKEAEQREAQQ